MKEIGVLDVVVMEMGDENLQESATLYIYTLWEWEAILLQI